MPTGTLRDAMRQACVSLSATLAFALGIAVFAPSSTESAAANGDTRTLHLFHTHTGETIDATFRVDGHYDQSVLRQLNHFLRDWRNDDEINMDPRLFDAVWEAYRTAGATDRIQIYSAYRSPETNAMLRRRSRAVAEHSQHMLGKAMDTTMPGFPMDRIRDAGMRLQHGGVGWYPSANFVHLDVGGVRSWPRMPYDQLVSLFPDGKTVHIASDGRTLPGYDAARIEIAERGGTDIPPAQESTGFFAWLFGGGNSGATTAREDEEDRRAPATPPASAPAAVAVAAVAPQQQEPQQQEPQQADRTVALAYTDASAQPLDGHLQVAALEPTDLDKAIDQSGGTEDSVMPLPPRRPAEFAEALDVPMPPARPRQFALLDDAPIRHSDAQTTALSTDPIGGLITASASGVPMIRKSRLPAIITRGTSAHASSPALAFAAVDGEVDETPRLRVPTPVARPANLGKGLRAAVARPPRQHDAMTIASAGIVAEDDDEMPVVAGPRLGGLRKAIEEAEKAAL